MLLLERIISFFSCFNSSVSSICYSSLVLFSQPFLLVDLFSMTTTGIEENHLDEEELEELDLEEEVGQGEEEYTRNIEDDSINLMLEEEEKMLEDEINESYRLDQVSLANWWLRYVILYGHVVNK